MTISITEFQKNVLNFIDQCYPSKGFFYSEKWEKSGDPHIFSSDEFVIPENEIEYKEKTMEQRIEDNDWKFASGPGGVESIEASHSAVEILWQFNILNEFDEASRKTWADYLNSFQDRETGLYLGCYAPGKNHSSWKGKLHSWRHMHEHLTTVIIPVLEMLGYPPKYKLSEGSITGRYLDPESLKSYLVGRDWNKELPWFLGNDFWFPAAILYYIEKYESGSEEARQARKVLNDIWYAWHDKNFGVNGFWYGEKEYPDNAWCANLKSGSEPENPETAEEYKWAGNTLMGGAHQMWFYAAEGHFIPDNIRKKQTDLILALQNRHDHLFNQEHPENPEGAKSCDCTDIDSMTVLQYNYKGIDYRRDDIKRAMSLALEGILTHKINDQGLLVNSKPVKQWTHGGGNLLPTSTPNGKANLLQQAFYQWAIAAACSVLETHSDKGCRTFVSHKWPHSNSYWYYVV